MPIDKMKNRRVANKKLKKRRVVRKKLKKKRMGKQKFMKRLKILIKTKTIKIFVLKIKKLKMK
jgi:hypothetical protein